MNKDIPLGLIWAELWNERQHLVGLPITGLELGLRIDYMDFLQLFITWHQKGKFNRVEQRYTSYELRAYPEAAMELTVTNGIRTLTKVMQAKVEALQNA